MLINFRNFNILDFTVYNIPVDPVDMDSSVNTQAAQMHPFDAISAQVQERTISQRAQNHPHGYFRLTPKFP